MHEGLVQNTHPEAIERAPQLGAVVASPMTEERGSGLE